MVYVLHLLTPLGHAGHYTGYAKDEKSLYARLEHHKNGTGARFTQVCVERGIKWIVAAVFPEGDKSYERRLKNSGGASRYCPVCILQKKKEKIK